MGHSQYFKAMLGMEEKFQNCDVWQVRFSTASKTNDSVGDKDNIHSADKTEQCDTRKNDTSEMKNRCGRHFHSSKNCQWIDPILLHRLE